MWLEFPALDSLQPLALAHLCLVLDNDMSRHVLLRADATTIQLVNLLEELSLELVVDDGDVDHEALEVNHRHTLWERRQMHGSDGVEKGTLSATRFKESHMHFLLLLLVFRLFIVAGPNLRVIAVFMNDVHGCAGLITKSTAQLRNHPFNLLDQGERFIGMVLVAFIDDVESRSLEDVGLDADLPLVCCDRALKLSVDEALLRAELFGRQKLLGTEALAQPVDSDDLDI